MNDLGRLAINTATLRQWTLEQTIEGCARRGIGLVVPWREQIGAGEHARLARRMRDAGVAAAGYCRGGLFPAATAAARRDAAERNRRTLDEAAALGAPVLTLVVGGLPGALDGAPAHRDLAGARAEVSDGIAAMLADARARGLRLAIEPLHPMYAADRSCVNTLDQALDLCGAIEPDAAGTLGVAVDCYHVWWDPRLGRAVERAGRERRLLGFHVCDWLVPTRDLLEDRGMMGDGVIEIARLRGAMEAAGYGGPAEVEIFSRADWWTRDGGEVLDVAIERFRSVV